jgi:hypothetical protein
MTFTGGSTIRVGVTVRLIVPSDDGSGAAVAANGIITTIPISSSKRIITRFLMVWILYVQ